MLSNTDAPSRRSAPEARRVNHWAPEGHMRRVQVEETRTSCMVVCGPSGGSVDCGNSVQSPLIPRRLFRDEEGDSQTMVAKGSRIDPQTRQKDQSPLHTRAYGGGEEEQDKPVSLRLPPRISPGGPTRNSPTKTKTLGWNNLSRRAVTSPQPPSRRVN